MTQTQKRRQLATGGARNEHFDSARPHDTASPADTLLPFLDALKSIGPGRWISRCPAHYDKTPSLSIREVGDGTLLLKCWTGCSAADVVAATGLDLRDLFPRRIQGRGPLRLGERWLPADVLRCVSREALVVAIAADDLAAGRPLSDVDRERVRSASIRLRGAAMEVSHE